MKTRPVNSSFIVSNFEKSLKYSEALGKNNQVCSLEAAD